MIILLIISILCKQLANKGSYTGNKTARNCHCLLTGTPTSATQVEEMSFHLDTLDAVLIREYLSWMLHSESNNTVFEMKFLNIQHFLTKGCFDKKCCFFPQPFRIWPFATEIHKTYCNEESFHSGSLMTVGLELDDLSGPFQCTTFYYSRIYSISF